LSEIFFFVSYQNVEIRHFDRDIASNLEDISTERAPLVLLFVCRLWHDIALNAPTLWTQIIFHGNPKQPRNITRWLENSRNLSLEVLIDTTLGRNFITRDDSCILAFYARFKRNDIVFGYYDYPFTTRTSPFYYSKGGWSLLWQRWNG